MGHNKIVVFESKEIRRVRIEEEWYFSVVDVIEALTDSINPRDYCYKMKIRVKTEDGLELSTVCRQLKLESRDDKKYATDCVNSKNLWYMVQLFDVYPILHSMRGELKNLNWTHIISLTGCWLLETCNRPLATFFLLFFASYLLLFYLFPITITTLLLYHSTNHHSPVSTA